MLPAYSTQVSSLRYLPKRGVYGWRNLQNIEHTEVRSQIREITRGISDGVSEAIKISLEVQ